MKRNERTWRSRGDFAQTDNGQKRKVEKKDIKKVGGIQPIRGAEPSRLSNRSWIGPTKSFLFFSLFFFFLFVSLFSSLVFGVLSDYPRQPVSQCMPHLALVCFLGLQTFRSVFAKLFAQRPLAQNRPWHLHPSRNLTQSMLSVTSLTRSPRYHIHAHCRYSFMYEHKYVHFSHFFM